MFYLWGHHLLRYRNSAWLLHFLLHFPPGASVFIPTNNTKCIGSGAVEEGTYMRQVSLSDT